MASNTRLDIFEFNNSSPGFLGDEPESQPDASFILNNDTSQSYPVASVNWNFQGTLPYDSYHPTSTTPPGAENYVALSWHMSALNQQFPPVAADNSSTSNFDLACLFAGSIPLANPDPAIGSRTPSANPRTSHINNLTPAIQGQLRNIASPPRLQFHSPKNESSLDLPTVDVNSGTYAAPETAAQSSSASYSRKRKVSANMEEEDEEGDERKSIKKTVHNMIEERYRTNLNNKMIALRDSVPSLRIISKNARGEDTTEDRAALGELTPAHKLNKATVCKIGVFNI
jgi:hypothetical protein